LVAFSRGTKLGVAAVPVSGGVPCRSPAIYGDGESGGRGDRIWAVGAACAWRSQVGGVGMSEPAGRGGVTAWEVGNFGRLGGVASGLGEGVLVEA
jgi:hypothetical protein